MARSATADALEKYRFLVDFLLPDGSAPVRTGFHDVQMPKRTTNKITYREGGDPDVSALSAGLSTMEDVVMSRGAIATEGNLANDFLKWAKAVHGPTAGNLGVNTSQLPTGTMQYRADVTIKMLNREGQIVRQWRLYNAFPTNFTPGSDLNAGEDGEKSMEALTLAYEDFQELQTATPGAAAGEPL